MVGAFIAGLAGGFVGGYLGAESGDPEVIYRDREIDYCRLAREVVECLKEERRKSIRDRIADIKRLESETAFKCGKCGKKISCINAKMYKCIKSKEGNLQFGDIKVDFIFGCDCKTEEFDEVFFSDVYGREGTEAQRIIKNNADWTCLFGADIINHNNKAFKFVFDRAYALWETQSDLDKKNGCTPYTQELERLNAMLSDPLGLTIDTKPTALTYKTEGI